MNTKRVTAVALVFAMLISIFSLTTTVSATETTSSDEYSYQILDNGTIKISDYTGDATNLTIPSEIDGITVTVIGESAFRNCDSLVSVTIPDSVTEVGSYAFSNNENLTSVTLGNSLSKILCLKLCLSRLFELFR
ncbi:MAG: leucine-rich repeat domain-containing protein [Acutalibacteraceae bacterium]|nr:leucine-rich repeat domain-containing protein [Acutalibacteraceae bacterium]